MSICVNVIDGFLKQSGASIGSCSDYVLMTAQEYTTQNPIYSHDDIVTMSWMVVSVWAAVWAIKVIKRCF